MAWLVNTLACALTLACGGEADGGAGSAGRPPQLVAVAPVAAGPLTVEQDLPGRVRAARHATLGAAAAGAVGRVLVNVGDEVSRGQLLFEVDPRDARAELAAARATADSLEEQHAQALRDAQRYSEAGTEAVAAAEIEQLRSQAEQLERRRREQAARLRQTRSRLAQQVVRAPFSGQVTERLADPGDWLTAGAPVLTLVDTGSVEVLAAASPDLVDDLVANAAATLRYGEQTTPARLAGVVRALDEQTGTAPVRVLPDGPAAWLLPGRFVRVTVPLVRDGGVVVPRDAIVQGLRGTRVVRVRDGLAEPLPVVVLLHAGARSLVRPAAEGVTLAPGDVVVVRGNERLRPQQPVQVQEPSTEAPTSMAPPSPAVVGSSGADER